MNLEEVLESKTFVRNGSPALSAQEYLEPVLEAFDKVGAAVNITTDSLVENQNETGEMNTSYGRVFVEATLPDQIEGLGAISAGFVYLLDKQVPEFVAYGGARVFACTNLCIWGSDMTLKVQDDHKRAQSAVVEYVAQSGKMIEEFKEFHNSLATRDVSYDEFERIMGHMLLNSGGANNYGSTVITRAARNFSEKKSVYYVEDETNMWNIYNGFTQVFTDRDAKGGVNDTPQQTYKLTKALMSFSQN